MLLADTFLSSNNRPPPVRSHSADKDGGAFECVIQDDSLHKGWAAVKDERNSSTFARSSSGSS